MSKKALLPAIVLVCISICLFGCSTQGNDSQQAQTQDDKLVAFEEVASIANSYNACTIYSDDSQEKIMVANLDYPGGPSILNYKFYDGKWSKTFENNVYHSDYKPSPYYQELITIPTIEEYGNNLIDEAVDKLKDEMYDPDSAKIEEKVFFAYSFAIASEDGISKTSNVDGNIVVLEVNAKNLYGAYTGKKTYAFRYKGDSLSGFYDENDKQELRDVTNAMVNMAEYPCFIVKD